MQTVVQSPFAEKPYPQLSLLNRYVLSVLHPSWLLSLGGMLVVVLPGEGYPSHLLVIHPLVAHWRILEAFELSVELHLLNIQ